VAIDQFASSYDMVPLFEDQKLEQSRRFIYEGEGAALLKEALLDSRKYEKLFDPKTFVWMYNIIQMNCSAINPQSPWEVYASNIKKIRPVEVPFFASKLSSVRQKKRFLFKDTSSGCRTPHEPCTVL